MREAVFRVTAMPQFSAEPSGVRRQRRESGNQGADQTQRATRNGAAIADESEGRRSRSAPSLLPQSQRASAVSEAPAYPRALTPRGTPLRLVSKNLLKTGAWTVLRVLRHDQSGALTGVGSGPARDQLVRVLRPAVHPRNHQSAVSAAARAACGWLPTQPKARTIDCGMSLASLQRSPGKQIGALQESER
jgi:hypothetical protein